MNAMPPRLYSARATHARHSFRSIAVVLPLVVLASAACDIAMADHREKATAEWRKTYELQPGGRVEIGNVNGKIQVTPSDGNSVEVIAVRTARGSTQEAAKQALERVQIKESATPSEIKIETHIDRGGGIFNTGSTGVEYTVRVPVGVELKASTVNGGVEVTGVGGKVVAETTNGGIKARQIAGPIEASTTNGGVDVDLTKVADGGVKLECTNGGIRLRLPSDSKASISARITNGGIETDGLSLRGVGENSRRRLDGDLNGGGPRISLEGTNGGIRISGR